MSTTLILLLALSGPQTESDAVALAIDEGYRLRGEVSEQLYLFDTVYQIDVWKDSEFGVVEIDMLGNLNWIPGADLSCGNHGCVLTYPDK